METRNNAFSLVELSIVLVILGLLTGGILAGQSLIRAAELRSVGTEYSKYITATQTFRDKYLNIPGDFRDASRFWLRMTSNATCVTNSAATQNADGVCDGDGDGRVFTSSGAGNPAEGFMFWRHLAKAGLIEGSSYSGLTGSGGGLHVTLGDNSPRSKLSQAGWSIVWHDNSGGSTPYMYTMNYGNRFMFGATAANSWNNTYVLKPEEAWNIDTKLDDGKPATGTIIAMAFPDICASADDGTSELTDFVASYRLNTTSVSCSLLIKAGF